MDVEEEHKENEVQNETEVSEKTSPTPVYENETEIVPSDHAEETSERRKAAEEATNEVKLEENSGNKLPDTNQDPTVEVKPVNDEPVTHEESVVFETNTSDEDGPPRLHLETPEKKITPPQEDKAGEEGLTPTEEISYEELPELLRELSEQRDKAIQRCSQLQGKLVEYLRKKGDDVQVEREMKELEQQEEFERNMKMLRELNQQIRMESETAQEQEEELRVQTQEKLDKVENEWREFLALKQDAAVSVLSRPLGKQAAQVKVESVLAAEQLRQDELIKLRLKHLNLRDRVHRLEAELCAGDQQRDPLQLQFESLQAQRLEQRKQTEKLNEESAKMQKKINSSLEVLSNVKEKLSWSRMEVQAKREQLAQVEDTLARKRELLTRIKKTRNSLQRDNLRLKESCGLLGNRALLRDFEDTVDTSDLLEEKLEDLKLRLSVVGGGGVWRQLS